MSSLNDRSIRRCSLSSMTFDAIAAESFHVDLNKVRWYFDIMFSIVYPLIDESQITIHVIARTCMLSIRFDEPLTTYYFLSHGTSSVDVSDIKRYRGKSAVKKVLK